jgi:hypothetical protein
MLSWAGVDDLFADLAALAQVDEILVRDQGAVRATAAPPELGPARRALREGRAAALQIRYRHEGTAWCDTLLRAGDEVRLVRVPVPRVGEPSGP